MKKINSVVVLFFVLLINNASFGQENNLVKAKEYVNQWLGEKKSVDYEIITVDSIFENQNSYLYLHRLSPKGYVLTNTKNELDIFAYSLEDNTSLEELQKPGVRFFMNGFIDYIKEKNFKIDVITNENKADIQAVSPLLTTNWNQDYPYNQYCPVDANGPNGRVYAGCIATAGGMMLKYYNNPVQGRGSHTYTHPTYGSLTANYGNTTYNWTAMGSNNYQEISKLLFHIGVAVNMDYGSDGSGAYTEDLQNAFREHFYTTPGIRHVRASYDLAEWKNLINESLLDGVPVLYDGYSSQGGHIWICDGYSDTGLYHMNWGWGGYSNGYFNLNNLNSYNTNQSIVLGVKPLNDSSLETYVPDDNFENMLIQKGWDYELDNYAYTELLKYAKNLTMINKNIADLTGIEDCINLDALIINSNQVSNINLLNLSKLKQVYMDNNNINTLDLGNCNLIEVLSIKNNNLESLDLTNLTNLKTLKVTDNDLSFIDLRNGNNTNLTSLNTTNNPNLTCIYVEDVNYCNTNLSTFIDITSHFVSSEAECVALSFDEFNDPSSVVVFPNPTSGILNFDNSEKVTLYEIYDTLGKKIASFYGNVTSIDISNFKSGIYILKVNFVNGNKSELKLIKN